MLVLAKKLQEKHTKTKAVFAFAKNSFNKSIKLNKKFSIIFSI
jgi:hypothetical protein